MRMTRQTAARIAACGAHMFIIGVFGAHQTYAQAQPGLRVGTTAPAPAALPAGAAPIVDGSEPRAVELLVGRSTLVEVGSPIARVSLTSAEVADALVTGQTQLLVHGKLPGSISMFVWDRAGAVAAVRDRRAARSGPPQRSGASELFPGEQIDAHSNGKTDRALRQRSRTKEVGEKAMDSRRRLRRRSRATW